MFFLRIIVLVSISGSFVGCIDEDTSRIDENEEREELADSNDQSSQSVYLGVYQCESNGSTLAQTAQALSDAGIDVLNSFCGALVSPVSDECGVNQGVDVHSVRPVNVQDALTITAHSYVVAREFQNNFTQIVCD